MNVKVWIFFIFVILGMILYAPAMDSVFTYDDGHQILENPSIRTLTHIPSFFTESSAASRSPEMGLHYRPLLLSSFAFNYAIGGGNPWGYHLINLSLHLLSAFLVFLVMSVLLRHWSGGIAAGLVLLAHPFNAEVVNYVTARSSVMASFFYVLAFYAYIRYHPPYPESEFGGTVPSGRWWLFISVGAFFMGILTKEIVVTLPAILLLYEMLIPSEKWPWKKLVRVVTPFLSVSLVYLLLRKLIVGAVGPTWVIDRSLGENVLIQMKSLAITWQMLLFPVNLSIEHDVPTVQGLRDGSLVISILLLVFLVTLMVLFGRSRNPNLRVTGFFLAWFYVTLLPTTVIPLHAVIQENRGYIAGIAFAGIVGVLVQGAHAHFRRKGRTLVWSSLGFILMLYSIGVWDRNQVWGDEVRLWKDAVQKTSDSYGPHFGLASAYQRRGRLDHAEVEYLEAVRLGAQDPLLFNDLGALYHKTGRLELALRQFEHATRIDPSSDLTYANLGFLYDEMGREKEAVWAFEKALLINPAKESVLVGLGAYYQRANQLEKAEALYHEGLRHNPDLPGVQMALGLLCQRHGDHHCAIRAFQKVVYLDPSSVNAYIALGQEYLRTQRPLEAIQAFEQALILRPGDAYGYLTLGKLYEEMGKQRKAEDLYKKILTLPLAAGQNQEALFQARKGLERLSQ
jgi:tetratricopeptide (TPR) repeat protein